MRIIAGKYKSRQLKAVPGRETRPTSNKIKEAVFHRMGPFFNGGTGLDLFAGSGSLGIEAISRGMDKVIFVDKSPMAVKMIHHNIKLLEAAPFADVFRNDALRALEVMSKKGEQFSLILLDPPYDEELYQKLIDTITTEELLKTGGLLYLEHRPKLAYRVEDELQVIFEKQYNDTTCVTILEKTL